MLMAGELGFRCLGCAGERQEIIGPTHGGDYRRCLECGLEVRVVPEGESTEASFDAAQQVCYVDQDVLGSPLMRLMHHWGAAARLRVVRRYLPQGRLFEVGPGGGELMVLARAAGFGVAGIEHSERLAHRLSTELGLEVACGTIEEADLSQSRTDAVVSLHVIEHVPDPRRHLSAARQAVVSGGFLFLATPNLGAWSRRVAGKRWPGYSAGHLHLFRASSLKR
ncbi:MAG: class I SAM-dependent methyltransferase, partial [Planctomycetes bacterium]|nr:class I SAM-dependent methyltransferase [Planctomycetota bacterium]